MSWNLHQHLGLNSWLRPISQLDINDTHKLINCVLVDPRLRFLPMVWLSTFLIYRYHHRRSAMEPLAILGIPLWLYVGSPDIYHFQDMGRAGKLSCHSDRYLQIWVSLDNKK